MFLRIEKGSAVPISRQIADQIRALCLAERLKPRDGLPSVRQLARELAVNQNTILRVYERLVAEGYLEMRHGEGTFVADRPPTWRLAEQKRQLGEELKQLICQARMLGLGDQQLRDLFQSALADSRAAVVAAETPGEKVS
jgi:GntR family transcriptional regulator